MCCWTVSSLKNVFLLDTFNWLPNIAFLICMTNIYHESQFNFTWLYRVCATPWNPWKALKLKTIVLKCTGKALEYSKKSLNSLNTPWICLKKLYLVIKMNFEVKNLKTLNFFAPLCCFLMLWFKFCELLVLSWGSCVVVYCACLARACSIRLFYLLSSLECVQVKLSSVCWAVYQSLFYDETRWRCVFLQGQGFMIWKILKSDCQKWVCSRNLDSTFYLCRQAWVYSPLRKRSLSTVSIFKLKVFLYRLICC